MYFSCFGRLRRLSWPNMGTSLKHLELKPSERVREYGGDVIVNP
jgi:hypothetical protein